MCHAHALAEEAIANLGALSQSLSPTVLAGSPLARALAAQLAPSLCRRCHDPPGPPGLCSGDYGDRLCIPCYGLSAHYHQDYDWPDRPAL
jgi:hypothetical protein